MELVRSANPALLLAAFVAYYLTFPLRSLRWWLVLRNVGTHVRYGDATEILFLSWFVNCLVPAKLGDLYRAYLLRATYAASVSRTVGTVFLERVADIILIFGLALAAGFWSFRGRNRPEVDALFLAGFVLVTALVIFVVVLRYLGAHLTRFLPERVADLYERFHEGSTGAMRPWVLLQLGAITAAVWLLEGARVLFVIQALNLPAVHELGITAAIFVALCCVAADGHPAHAGRHRLRAGRHRAGADQLLRRAGGRGDGGGARRFRDQHAERDRDRRRRVRLLQQGPPGAREPQPDLIGTFGSLEPTLPTAILRLLGRTTGALSR